MAADAMASASAVFSQLSEASTTSELRAARVQQQQSLENALYASQVRGWVLARTPERVFDPQGASRRQYGEWFRLLDVEGIGHVSRGSIETLCNAIGTPVAEPRLRAMFATVEKRLDQPLTEPDFLKLMAHHGHELGALQKDQGTVAVAFLAVRRASLLEGMTDSTRRRHTVRDIQRTLRRLRQEETAAAAEARAARRALMARGGESLDALKQLDDELLGDEDEGDEEEEGEAQTAPAVPPTKAAAEKRA